MSEVKELDNNRYEFIVRSNPNSRYNISAVVSEAFLLKILHEELEEIVFEGNKIHGVFTSIATGKVKRLID